jgi:hypothetical protein
MRDGASELVTALAKYCCFIAFGVENSDNENDLGVDTVEYAVATIEDHTHFGRQARINGSDKRSLLKAVERASQAAQICLGQTPPESV